MGTVAVCSKVFTPLELPLPWVSKLKDVQTFSSPGVELFKKEKYDLIIVDTSGRHKHSWHFCCDLFGFRHAQRHWGHVGVHPTAAVPPGRSKHCSMR